MVGLCQSAPHIGRGKMTRVFVRFMTTNFVNLDDYIVEHRILCMILRRNFEDKIEKKNRVSGE